MPATESYRLAESLNSIEQQKIAARLAMNAFSGAGNVLKALDRS